MALKIEYTNSVEKNVVGVFAQETLRTFTMSAIVTRPRKIIAAARKDTRLIKLAMA